MGETIGIDSREILFAIVNFLILVGVLAKFLYNPYLNMLEARKQAIADSFDQAAETNRLADVKMDEYTKRIADVESEVRELIKNAKIKAEAQAEEIVAEANRQAIEMKQRAEKEIEKEKIKAIAEMKSQIAEIALLAAEKIIEKDLDTEGQDILIDNILGQVGEAEWQN